MNIQTYDKSMRVRIKLFISKVAESLGIMTPYAGYR